MRIIYAAGVVILLIVGAALFVNSVGGGKSDHNSAVKLQSPPGFFVIRSGVSPEKAENSLIAEIIIETRQKNPLQEKISVEFRDDDILSIFLIDFGEDIMQKRMENSSGTIVESTWRGAVGRRIELGRKTGQFSGGGLSDPENKNLYH
ncbi:MAG: hypothetical protein AB7T22_03605 [Calditrichaceae bacterium]